MTPADRPAPLGDPGAPGDPGAYVLFIALPVPLAVEARSLAPGRLAPGRYAYCGSAYGPGGLAARLRRHLKRAKRAHWHVDALTAAGRVFAVGLAPGGRECALVEGFLRHGEVAAPLAGFGSSDCRRCPAHLLQLAPGSDAGRLARALGLVWLDVRDDFGSAF